MTHNGKEWEECPASEATCWQGNGLTFNRTSPMSGLWRESKSNHEIVGKLLSKFGGKFYREAPQPKVYEVGEFEYKRDSVGWIYRFVGTQDSWMCASEAMGALLDRIADLTAQLKEKP